MNVILAKCLALHFISSMKWEVCNIYMWLEGQEGIVFIDSIDVYNFMLLEIRV
jgi:hypothetical protein